ncbi:glycosyltransferase family 4 protein [Adlercreutzia sp. ZJ141]|uniref:glycosyltransferase family 4 protein n=1 Tax=Adlercreutzia sp. ZJ141 TaxID=2709406 RepID=UPI00197F7F0B|nr:glycosyltransferase family 4 protein [Adlercreutzia sp. ZJ141]
MLVAPLKASVIGTRGFPGVEGGVERHCECLYTRLARKANILVYRRKPYVEPISDYEGVHFKDLPSTKLKGVEAVIHSLLATLAAFTSKPDVVHYHNIGPALFSPLLSLRSIPVVLTYHSPNYEHDKWGKVAKSVLRLSERVALKSASRVIFVNSHQMLRCGDESMSKAVFIPNGVEAPVAPSGTGALARFGLEPDGYVLSVGRITPEKGFDVLIRAFRAIAPEGFKLVVVGGVESERAYSEGLRELAEGAPVVFTGQLHGDDLAQMYANAALYVLASRNEGFPLALLEAMSYGLDVVVSDIPATHLVRLLPGDYFPMDSSSELAEVMNRKLVHPTRRAYELSSFDWDEVAEKTLVVYEAAIKEEGGML